LIVWTESNYNSLPKGDWNFVGEKRLRVLEIADVTSIKMEKL
jgi:hypothetical protein